MKLSVAGQQQAKAFIKSKARPLEQSLYAFHFEGAGPEGVLRALESIQNADGGYGHGVEPDLPMPGSSAICTTRALQVLAKVGASPASPLVSRAVRYLLDTYDPKAQVWKIVPRSVNEGPHAPWWHYDDHGQAEKWGGYLVNPRAEILGCFSAFAAAVPSNFLRTLTEAVLEHLENQPGPKNMHDITCYLNLLETSTMPGQFRRRLLVKLEPAVAAAVERDPAKWDQYCLKPAGYMGVARSPASPFAGMLVKEVELSLDHEIERQHTDGSWLPSWSWGQFPEAWEQAKLAWQGILTVQTLKMLASFGRLHPRQEMP